MLAGACRPHGVVRLDPCGVPSSESIYVRLYYPIGFGAAARLTRASLTNCLTVFGFYIGMTVRRNSLNFLSVFDLLLVLSVFIIKLDTSSLGCSASL